MDEKAGIKRLVTAEEIDYDSSTSRESADLLNPMEKNDLIDEESQTKPMETKKHSKLTIWIIVNVVSTITIVFVNKAIFNDPKLGSTQVTFTAFHLFITWITLHIVSTARFGVFERRTARLRDILPLAASAAANVVILNTSLQFCSVPFYQTVRVLLTPVTALLNYLLYTKTIPRQAAYMLIPICAGAAMMSYFDVKPASGGASKGSETTAFGAGFALLGVLVSSIYTVWMQHYHQKLEMSSPQLLHQQSLVGGVLLLYVIPFVDTLPRAADVTGAKWALIILSGVCAILINLSQFTIVNDAGAVAGTVVGHAKTICIVSLGWILSGKAVSGNSFLGCAIAIVGVVLYSTATIYYRR